MEQFDILNDKLSHTDTILERRTEPTLWNSSSPNQWQKEYLKNGCVIFHSFFQHQNPVELDIELKRIRENPAAGKILESRSHEVRSQFNLHNIAPALIKNLVTTELIEIASSILGGEPLIYQSHLNFKSPFRGEAYDWHSDYVYWKHHDGMLEPRAISIVFPLSSHSIENGGLEVLVGSHGFYYSTQLKRERNWQLDEIRHDPNLNRETSGLVPLHLVKQIDSQKITIPKMNLGDVFIMDANLWHQSPSNYSAHGRATLFLILISATTRFEAINKAYRPEFISCRKKLPLRSFLNQKMT